MKNRGVRNLFVYGSLLCFAALVVITFDTYAKLDARAPQITDEVNKGKIAWHKYDCIGCHTILGNGSYFAPDMTKITQHVPHSYLKKFLVNPKKVNLGSNMPVLGVSAEEADHLISFLDWISQVDTNGWPPKPIYTVTMKSDDSASVYHKYECAICHTVNGVGGTSGPDLSHVATRQPDPQWHKQHLINPVEVVADSAMPPYPQMSGEELDKLVKYLLTLK
ncbi:MAG: c-type cytochrome [Nitrospirae bacterium]|uniref:c-type cytochrome n=1 Tax=Candidatus Magnetobacterium casense TaxID=1455061 RepID=UPI0006987F08|nr:c-type cytochrome [Candidatus Magnetobacterium casensis]MBF0336342.1 c-type cytochrome [Nitrospirota bacterium]